MVGVKQKGSVDKWTGNVAKKVEEGTAKTMLLAAQTARGAVTREIYQGGRFKNPRNNLAESYTATLLAPKQGKLRSGAISDSVYARIQDQGGTIVPKNVSLLTIPISDRAKRFFEAGGTAKEFNKKFKRVKDLVDIAYTKGPVRLPAKHYLDAAAADVEPELEELFDGAIGVAAGEAESE